MIIAVHTIVSGVVGEEINNPLLAFVAGIILHFFFDFLPHYDSTDGGKWTGRQFIFTCVDFVLTLSLLLFIKSPISFNSPFWWGVLGGNMIDVFDNTPFWQESFRTSRWGSKVHGLHVYFHSKKRPDIVLGILFQIAIIAGFLALHFVK